MEWKSHAKRLLWWGDEDLLCVYVPVPSVWRIEGHVYPKGVWGVHLQITSVRTWKGVRLHEDPWRLQMLSSETAGCVSASASSYTLIAFKCTGLSETLKYAYRSMWVICSKIQIYTLEPRIPACVALTLTSWMEHKYVAWQATPVHFDRGPWLCLVYASTMHRILHTHI